MTPEEFHAILRAMRSHGRKRPTPAHRFRKVLIFLYLTGCRPGEAAKLRWEHINFKLNIIVLAGPQDGQDAAGSPASGHRLASQGRATLEADPGEAGGRSRLS